MPSPIHPDHRAKRRIGTPLSTSYEQGVLIEKIQDVLGHSSPTITKLIYVEVTRQAQRSTTDKLRCLFDG